MEEILKKYYLSKDMVLVHAKIGTNGVDAWFENATHQAHRCITLKDYNYVLTN